MPQFLWTVCIVCSIIDHIYAFDLEDSNDQYDEVFYSKLKPPTNFKASPIPPKLNLRETFADIAVNSTFVVECMGNRPIDWKISPDYYNGEINIIESVGASSQIYPYSSKLILSKAQYTDTNLYSCQYNQTNLDRPSDSTEYSASVYVYVNDDEHLLIKEYSFISATPSSVLEIPCRATNSKANVTLWKNEDSEDVFDDKNPLYAHYDHQRGFVISFPHLFYSGLFKCKANVGDIESESKIAIHFVSSESDNPRPFIELNGTEHALISSSFSLNCVVDIEADEIADLTWTYPGKFKGNSSGRYLIHQPEATVYNDTEISNKQYESRLTILDAQNYDEGHYTCKVFKGSHQTEATVYVKVAGSLNLAPRFFMDWIAWLICLSCLSFSRSS